MCEHTLMDKNTLQIKRMVIEVTKYYIIGKCGIDRTVFLEIIKQHAGKCLKEAAKKLEF